MKTLALLTAFTFLSLSSSAQVFDWKWVKSANSTSVSAGLAIAHSPDSSFVYVGGRTNGNALSLLGILNLGLTGTDAFVAKYTTNGTLVWSFMLASTGFDEVTCITVSNSDEVIVGGSFSGNLNFQGVSGASISKAPVGGADGFVAKYNSNGILQWVTVASSNQNVALRDVKISGGEIYAAGDYEDVLSVGTSSLTNSGGFDAFGMKLASNGSLTWLVGAGSDQDDSYNTVTAFGGNAYFGGFYTGNVLTFNSTAVVSLNNSQVGSKEGVLSKYNSSTGALVSHGLVYGQGDDEVTDLTNDGTKIYYTGYFENSTVFPGLTSVSVPHREFFVARCAANLNTEWRNYATTSGANLSEGKSIDINSSQQLVATGFFAGSTTYLGSNLTSNGTNDFIVAYIDPTNGTGINIKNYGGSSDDFANSVSIKSNQEIYVTGTIRNTVVFTPITKTATANNNVYWGKYGCITGTAVISGSTAICIGDSALLTFTLTGTSPFKFKYTNGTDTFSVGPLVTNSYTTYVSPSSTKTYQLVSYESFACSSSVSGSAVITVYAPVTNNDILNSNEICPSGSTVLLDGNLPSGGGGSYIYNWEFSQNGLPFGSLGPPVSTEDYNATASATVTKYRRLAKTAACPTWVSSDTITIDAPMTGNFITTGPQTICQGTAVSINAPIPTNGGTFIYLWEQSADSTVWTSANNTNPNNLQNYIPPILTTTTYFRRQVKSGACGFSPSSGVKITVHDPIVNNTIVSTSQFICSTIVPDTIFADTALGGENGLVFYKWQDSIVGGSWNDASGVTADSTSYSPGLLTQTTFYRRVVSGSVCGNDTTVIYSITVDQPVTANSIAADTTICYGTAPNPIQGLPSTNGYPISWEKNLDSNNVGGWTLISGATLNTFNPGIITDTIYFRRIVDGGFCPDSYSNVVTVNVPLPISNNIISSDMTVCYGTDSLTLAGSTLAGGSGNNSLIWESSTDNITFTPIAINGNQVDYTTGTMNSTIYYRRRAVNNDCITQDSISNTIEIIVLPNATANIVSSKDSLCSGENLSVNIELTGNGPFGLYAKYGATNQDVFGVAGPSYSLNFLPLVSETLYLDSLIDGNGCVFEVSDSTVVKVVTNPSTNIAAVDTSLCDSIFIFTPVLSVGSAQLSSPTLGFIGSTFPLTFVDTSYTALQFILTETNEFCSDSDTVNIQFSREIGSISAGADQFVYQTDQTFLEASDLVGSEIGNWYIIDNYVYINDVNDPKTLVQQLLPGETHLLWEVISGVCPVKNDTVKIIVQNLFIPSGFSPNGDGNNDEFYIEGIGNYDKIELQVFNRWGNVVFESKNYENNWKGLSSSGENLPEDTYFYILDLDNDEMYKGYLIIKR